MVCLSFVFFLAAIKISFILFFVYYSFFSHFFPVFDDVIILAISPLLRKMFLGEVEGIIKSHHYG